MGVGEGLGWGGGGAGGGGGEDAGRLTRTWGGGGVPPWPATVSLSNIV